MRGGGERVGEGGGAGGTATLRGCYSRWTPWTVSRSFPLNASEATRCAALT